MSCNWAYIIAKAPAKQHFCVEFWKFVEHHQMKLTGAFKSGYIDKLMVYYSDYHTILKRREQGSVVLQRCAKPSEKQLSKKKMKLLTKIKTDPSGCAMRGQNYGEAVKQHQWRLDILRNRRTVVEVLLRKRSTRRNHRNLDALTLVSFELDVSNMDCFIFIKFEGQMGIELAFLIVNMIDYR